MVLQGDARCKVLVKDNDGNKILKIFNICLIINVYCQNMRQILKPVELFTLAALLQCALHNYAVKQQITEISGRLFTPDKSTLKRSLERLLAQNLIEECSNPNYWVDDRICIPYQLTAAGRSRIERELLMYLRLIDVSKMWLQRRALASASHSPFYEQPRLSQIPLRDLSEWPKDGYSAMK